MVTEKPFVGRTRLAFMQYLCERHNEVNSRLSTLSSTEKPVFPCEFVEKAWGQMGCGCEFEELVRDLSKTGG